MAGLEKFPGSTIDSDEAQLRAELESSEAVIIGGENPSAQEPSTTNSGGKARKVTPPHLPGADVPYRSPSAAELTIISAKYQRGAGIHTTDGLPVPRSIQPDAS